jgi:hypothetical protein
MPNRIILFDSKQARRISGTNSVEFSFDNTFSDINAVSINHVSVQSTEFPNVFYNLYNDNNTISYTILESDMTVLGNYTAIIPIGQYTQSTFVAQLIVSMTGAYTHTVTISPLTSILTIQQLEGKLLRLNFDASTIGGVIGITKDTTPSTSTTLEKLLDLRGLQSLLISSNLSIDGIATTGAGHSHDYLHHVSLDVPFGTTAHNTVTSPVRFMTSKIANPIKFIIKTATGTTVNINKFDWKVSLLVNYE